MIVINKVKYLLGIAIFFMTLGISYESVEAKIDVSPTSIAQGVTSSTIYVDVGGAECYVKYTGSTSFPSVSTMWRIPAGNNVNQTFGGIGKWYLHVYNVKTGEKRTTGPYCGEVAAPNNPTVNISESGWTNNDVYISINDNGDNGSTGYDLANDIYTYYEAGVDRIEYGYSTDPWKTYRGGTWEKKEGWKVLESRVIDRVGNVSGTIKSSFGIDKTSPNIKGIPSKEWTKDNVLINISATDTLSGMKSLELYDGSYKLLASGISSLSFPVKDEGEHFYTIKAVDNAKNEKEIDFEVKIDKSAPEVYGIPDGYDWIEGNGNLWTNEDVVMDISAYDYHSGLKDIRLFNGSGNLLRSVEGDNSLKYTEKNDGKYKYTVVARDIVINENRQSFSVNIDKSLPSCSEIKFDNVTSVGFNMTLGGVTDNAGIGVENLSMDIWGDGEDEPSKDTTEGYIKIIRDSTGRYVYNYNNIKECRYGKVNVRIYGSDKLGNEGKIKDGSVIIPRPIPYNNDLKVTKYDYKENDSTYWVKTESDFNIETTGFFPSELEIFPTYTSTILKKDNKDSSPLLEHRTYSDRYEVLGDEFDKYLVEMYDSLLSEKITADSNIKGVNSKLELSKDNITIDGKVQEVNKIKGNHRLQALNDGDYFKLYSKNGYEDYHYNEYSSTPKDSNLWLKVDGEAPIGEASIEIDKDTLDISVAVSNVSDKDGSGIKKIYAKYYPSNYDDYDDEGEEYYTKDLTMVENNEKNWSDIVNGYDLYQSDRIKVKVCSVDNVGNERLLGEKTVDIFTVRARVIPWNDQLYPGENPILKGGQKAILKIKTTGAPTKLNIKFPEKLTELDESINYSIDIEKKKVLETNYEFFVPLYSPSEQFDIEVEAIKGDRTRTCYPQFIIEDIILSRVRTRLR